MKKCVVLEMENKTDFENSMNDYLSDGYKVEASSCNSKYYKAILVLSENTQAKSQKIRIWDLRRFFLNR